MLAHLYLSSLFVPVVPPLHVVPFVSFSSDVDGCWVASVATTSGNLFKETYSIPGRTLSRAALAVPRPVSVLHTFPRHVHHVGNCCSVMTVCVDQHAMGTHRFLPRKKNWRRKQLLYPRSEKGIHYKQLCRILEAKRYLLQTIVLYPRGEKVLSVTHIHLLSRLSHSSEDSVRRMGRYHSLKKMKKK